jgi:tRNA(Ile2) C34 agmatinyltransferase TiaS
MMKHLKYAGYSMIRKCPRCGQKTKTKIIIDGKQEIYECSKCNPKSRQTRLEND